MTWPSDIADELPAPRDDEPPELRQDIEDELADHLMCSIRRELYTARDEVVAQRRAVDRFGDPRRIARELWLISMMEKLMSQRFALAASLIAALASVVVCALVIVAFNGVRDVNQALLAKVETLVPSRALPETAIPAAPRRGDTQSDPQRPEENVIIPAAENLDIDSSETAISLIERAAKTVTLKHEIRSVAGFDPENLKVTSITPNRIGIQALKDGATNLLITDAGGVVFRIEVEIQADTRELTRHIKTLFPESSVDVIRIRDSCVLRGYVSRQDEIARIVEIAEQFHPRVLNHLEVAVTQR